jgi:hypothetical protein
MVRLKPGDEAPSFRLGSALLIDAVSAARKAHAAPDAR